MCDKKKYWSTCYSKQTQNISDQLQAILSAILIYSEGAYIHQAEDIKLNIYLNHNLKK